jgi:hypothetical protein
MEGMLSQTWQSWCEFCRSAVIESCLGTTTATGTVTVPLPQWVDEGRVCYEAKVFANGGKNVKVGAKTTTRREEFTWGDVNRLVSAIGGLSPTNKSSLLSGFGVGLLAPRHMQLVRNAAAHWNSETMADVRKLTAYYSGAIIQHPTDLMVSDEIATRTPAFIAWTRDIRIMAQASIQ